MGGSKEMDGNIAAREKPEVSEKNQNYVTEEILVKVAALIHRAT